MGALHILVEAGFVLVLVLAVTVVVRSVRKAEHRMGFDAFHDNLPLNPKWSKQMREGWKDARDDNASIWSRFDRA